MRGAAQGAPTTCRRFRASFVSSCRAAGGEHRVPRHRKRARGAVGEERGSGSRPRARMARFGKWVFCRADDLDRQLERAVVKRQAIMRQHAVSGRPAMTLLWLRLVEAVAEQMRIV